MHRRIQVADTVLDCNDTEGPHRPVVLLNGMYGTQKDWASVQRLLNGKYRVITFDERARGKSRRSADYSFAGCLDDLAAVTRETNLKLPLLVGWSHGAAVAVRYASQHPDDIAGIVCVDGAFPMDPIDDAERQNIRKLFRRMALPMRILAAVGRSARMSTAAAAEANIELHDVLAGFAANYDRIRCPVTFVNAGATDEQLARMRAGIDPIVDRNPLVTVFATVPATHTRILAKHPDTIVAALDTVAAGSRN